MMAGRGEEMDKRRAGSKEGTICGIVENGKVRREKNEWKIEK